MPKISKKSQRIVKANYSATLSKVIKSYMDKCIDAAEARISGFKYLDTIQLNNMKINFLVDIWCDDIIAEIKLTDNGFTFPVKDIITKAKKGLNVPDLHTKLEYKIIAHEQQLQIDNEVLKTLNERTNIKSNRDILKP